MNATARTTETPWTLISRAAGSPRGWAAKVRDLARALSAYADRFALDDRLERLVALGYIEKVPTRLQLAVGSVDMLRFWISPAAEDYYRSQGIGYGLHQVLRVLDDPSSMVDPTGFLSTADNIIGHLMQVVHANPCYDLQLLESHEGGLEELERQVESMLAGTHPRAVSIGAIVEEPDYHARLLEYVRAYRANPDVNAPLRDNIATDPRWQRLERTFGTVSGAMGYFANLPSTPLAAAQHLLTVKEFPHHLSPASRAM
ncbi:MAG: hypothetical protein H6719_28420 [Sandaracinaceae bacterium]|nr:hypothetical protein [Sandaracinaceae bacterium]